MNYFIESSAKTGFNAEKIFVQAAKLLYTEYKEIAKNQQENKVINKKLENINNINNIVKNKKKWNYQKITKRKKNNWIWIIVNCTYW